MMPFQLVGFFAGIHLAVLGAYVCHRHPNASVNALLSRFFDIFSHWPWPLPVSLHDQTPLWSPDGCSLMPIVMPCFPPEFCASSVTKSTFNKIENELRRGFALTKVCLFVLYVVHSINVPLSPIKVDTPSGTVC